MYNRKLLKKELYKSFRENDFEVTDLLRFINEGSSRVVFSFLEDYVVKVPKKIYDYCDEEILEAVYNTMFSGYTVQEWRIDNPFINPEYGIKFINGTNQSKEEIEFFVNFRDKEWFNNLFVPLEDYFYFKGLPIIVMRKYSTLTELEDDSDDFDLSDLICCEFEISARIVFEEEEIFVGDVYSDNLVLCNENYLLCDYGFISSSKFSLF